MNSTQFLMFFLFLGAVSTGCSVGIPLGHGRQMHLFDPLERVQVTNNTENNGVLEVNGVVAAHLVPGKTVIVPLYVHSTALTFKVYDSQSRYLGMAQQVFELQNIIYKVQVWPITGVWPAQRQF